MGSTGAKQTGTTARRFEISGEVDYQTLRGVTPNVVQYDKISTITMTKISFKDNVLISANISRKGDVINQIIQRDPSEFVAIVWNDKSGAKFVDQLQKEGYKAQAHATHTKSQGNVPSREAFLFVKKSK